ncbi:hypothetical protein ELY33_17180 [Vreelandella andesensis]|uniref:Glutamate 5-kinase n=1 Tax=Vreelandella andesensis TaxID=447567 RepID=A0A433KFB5_9GAMM|nr:hypothetical protein [Halomonas andesensis]RUR26841.1 hypothetical protein ELY33_17180 [Halomonas andesensis]
MSLRDDIQADIAEAFDNDLADAVTSFTGSRETAGSYDPVSGTTSTTTTTYIGRGVFDDYSIREIDGQHIKRSDQKLTALQNEVTDMPQVDDTIDGFTVISVGNDPAAATYTIQLRKT